MSWKDDILSKKVALEQYRTSTLITDITKSKDSDARVKTAALNNIKAKFLAYQALNKQLSQIVRESTPTDIGSTLASVGQLQQDIQNLKSELKTTQADVEVAEDREKQMQQDPVEVSNYEGVSAKIGVVKPLYRISVPFLIGSGLFLIIVSVLLFKENILVGIPVPTLQQQPSYSVLSFLKDPRIWGSLFGAACIVILFLALKISGKLPILP
jgi:hypothetical protein